MRFPPPWAMAQLGGVASDARHDDTISHLQYWLEQYQEEYAYLMRYTAELKQLFAELNEEARETGAMDGYFPPEGIITSLGARFTGINFFEAGSEILPKEKRVYSQAFSSARTRYIWWELNLKHIAVPKRIDFQITTQIFLPNNERLTLHTSSQILPEWEWSHHVGIGGTGKIAVPKGVPLGIYQITLWIGEEYVGLGEFEVR